MVSTEVDRLVGMSESKRSDTQSKSSMDTVYTLHSTLGLRVFDQTMHNITTNKMRKKVT